MRRRGAAEKEGVRAEAQAQRTGKGAAGAETEALTEARRHRGVVEDANSAPLR